MPMICLMLLCFALGLLLETSEMSLAFFAWSKQPVLKSLLLPVTCASCCACCYSAYAAWFMASRGPILLAKSVSGDAGTRKMKPATLVSTQLGWREKTPFFVAFSTCLLAGNNRTLWLYVCSVCSRHIPFLKRLNRTRKSSTFYLKSTRFLYTYYQRIDSPFDMMIT